MTRGILEKRIDRAIINLLKRQPDIFQFTPETGVTEWNLAHHLAIELHRFLPTLACDLELMKEKYERR